MSIKEYRPQRGGMPELRMSFIGLDVDELAVDVEKDRNVPRGCEEIASLSGCSI